MHRHLLKLGIFVQAISLAAQPAWAEEAAGGGWMGPGGYASWWKILIFWVIFLIWVRMVDWVNRDLEDIDLDYMQWNPIVFAPFFVIALISLFVPIFWVNLPLWLLALIVPSTIYVVKRNALVDKSDKVFTVTHFKRLLAGKKKGEVDEEVAVGPPADFEAVGGSLQERNMRLIPARQNPGFMVARRLVADAIARRGDILMMDLTANAATLKISIDGMWFDAEAPAVEEAFPAVDSLKILCGLNPQDRINPQQGQFRTVYAGTKLKSTLITQGNGTMERAIIRLEPEKCPFKSLDQLGMRPEIIEKVKGHIAAEKSAFIFSAPAGQGLRTTVHVTLNVSDRFMREYAALEATNMRYDEVENVPVTTFDPTNREALIEALRKLVHMDPNVVVFRDIPDGEILEIVARDALEENRLLLTTTRANDTVQALLQIASLQPKSESFPQLVGGVLCQRLVRRLCDKCRQPYAPQPQLLQQLGLPPGSVQAFFQPGPPNPEKPEEVCEQCAGIGYFGRIAVFEYLAVNDQIRQLLAQGADYNTLYAAAVQSGMVPMFNEGIYLAAGGLTSIQELMRVFRGQ